MTSKDIDHAVLAVVGTSWRKVAFIIAHAADALGIAAYEGDPQLYEVADRIESLVREGHLVAQGNLSLWRYSEVRLP